MTTIAELKKNCSYDPSDIRWLDKGGELLSYLGLEVMVVNFTRTEKGEAEDGSEDKWTNSVSKALLMSADEFDPMTETYVIKWKEVNYEKPEEEWEVKETRIVPPGFSYGNPSESGEMIRFIPYSLHTKKMETEAYFAKLTHIFNTPEKFAPMNFLELSGISDSKDKDRTLKHVHNIVLVLKPEGEEEICAFRIGNLSLAHQFKSTYKLNVKDVDEKYELLLNLEVDEDNKTCKINWLNPGNRKNMGEVKLFDLRNVFAMK